MKIIVSPTLGLCFFEFIGTPFGDKLLFEPGKEGSTSGPCRWDSTRSVAARRVSEANHSLPLRQSIRRVTKKPVGNSCKCKKDSLQCFYMHRKGNILVCVSSADKVPLREGGFHATGVFLGELTEPLSPLLQSGYTIDFVSPDGRPPTIDPNSHNLLYWGFKRSRLEEAKEVKKVLSKKGMKEPRVLSELLDVDGGLRHYDLLFVPGGHAPMTDLLYEDWTKGEALNEQTAHLLEHFHQKGKPTVLICHAPSILAAAGSKDGRWLYDGYAMTCVTMMGEWLIEDAPGFRVIHGHLPDYPEHILRRKGAKLKQMPIPMISNIVDDRELLTGQDPYSARKLGIVMKSKLNAYLTLQ